MTGDGDDPPQSEAIDVLDTGVGHGPSFPGALRRMRRVVGNR